MRNTTRSPSVRSAVSWHLSPLQNGPLIGVVYVVIPSDQELPTVFHGKWSGIGWGFKPNKGRWDSFSLEAFLPMKQMMATSTVIQQRQWFPLFSELRSEIGMYLCSGVGDSKKNCTVIPGKPSYIGTEMYEACEGISANGRSLQGRIPWVLSEEDVLV